MITSMTNFGHLFNVTIALAIAVAVATSSTSGDNSEPKTPADVRFDENNNVNLFEKTLAACGMRIYDSSTHMCCDDFIMPRPSPHTECCGNLRYDNRYYKCCGTTLSRKDRQMEVVWPHSKSERRSSLTPCANNPYTTPSVRHRSLLVTAGLPNASLTSPASLTNPARD
ncbi:hypothetical protein LSAT2_010084 [Lamellibrachia satsuma]|nr:hypothetical protein LSAT2_010084 [Lamellibrachia satsuma]